MQRLGARSLLFGLGEPRARSIRLFGELEVTFRVRNQPGTQQRGANRIVAVIGFSKHAAGADPTSTGGTGTGTGGTGGSVEPDDACEVTTLRIEDDVCQVETSCVEFVQHTNCYRHNAELWQCDTDEHDTSKPQTLTGNPAWYNSVTGTSDAAAACDAVVAVNLQRSSVMPSDSQDCSQFSAESEPGLAHFKLCGARHHASSGATIWEELAASANCQESVEGSGQSCKCLNTGADDGEYLLDAGDLESALADVWEFCTNSSPRVPVEQRGCELIGAETASDGSCDDIRNCLVALTDASGVDLEQRVYQEVVCGRESPDAEFTCTCRLGNETLSFLPTEVPGVSACEDLASACDARSSVERAAAPAECERNPELIGHDRLMQGYICSLPIVLGTKSGLIQDYGGLVCKERPDGGMSCSCYDSFSRTTFPLEPNTPDLETAWDIAVVECEALLEASPVER